MTNAQLLADLDHALDLAEQAANNELAAHIRRMIQRTKEDNDD